VDADDTVWVGTTDFGLAHSRGGRTQCDLTAGGQRGRLIRCGSGRPG
jgi:hypothetical protein